MLSRRISDPSNRTTRARLARHISDTPAPSLKHMRNHSLHQEDRRRQVHADIAGPHSLADRVDAGNIVHDARDVAETVDGFTVRFYARADDRGRRPGLGQVALQELEVGDLQLGGAGGGADVDGEDLGSGGDEGLDQGEPDAGTAACDEDDLGFGFRAGLIGGRRGVLCP